MGKQWKKTEELHDRYDVEGGHCEWFSSLCQLNTCPNNQKEKKKKGKKEIKKSRDCKPPGQDSTKPVPCSKRVFLSIVLVNLFWVHSINNA